jgi:endonuclease/exonuclease/phosphatase family metal-dependent hydrolase
MSMRLGTFNVWGLPESFADDVSSRMRGLAARLHGLDLDLLLIQEAWTDEVRDTLRDAALDAGFEVAGGEDSTGGLMVLSRIPIESSRFERFHFRGDPERIAQGEFLGGKGFQVLHLETANGPLSLINTHLHARYRRSRPRLNSAVRVAQLLQIVGTIHEMEGTIVVGGDFNCSPEDPEYMVFKELTRAFELGDGRSHPTLSNTNFYKRHRIGADKRIDYLFVRPGPGVRWQVDGADSLFDEPELIRRLDRSLSDHFGFRASLDWDRPPAAPTHGSTGLDRTASREPDPKVFDLARVLLDIGHEEADRRERIHFRSAGGWIAAAALAAGLRRHPALDRRRFLRASSRALAVVALAPAVAYGTLARFDSDQKRNAFEDARDVLAAIRADKSGTA